MKNVYDDIRELRATLRSRRWLHYLLLDIRQWVAEALAVVMLFSAPCYGASVSLKWDPNAPADEVKFYTVYWGNYSGSTAKFAFKNHTSVPASQTTATVVNISPLEKWYFRVTATNDTMESQYSNKVYLNFIRTPAAVKFQSIDVR